MKYKITDIYITLTFLINQYVINKKKKHIIFHYIVLYILY